MDFEHIKEAYTFSEALAGESSMYLGSIRQNAAKEKSVSHLGPVLWTSLTEMISSGSQNHV